MDEIHEVAKLVVGVSHGDHVRVKGSSQFCFRGGSFP